ncbi:hypothetical protein [Jiangella ureilytica]|nr:hypothetical protein [Jiangella ureilytica]
MSDPRDTDQATHEAEEHDQDAEPTKNAPDAGRPDLTELSDDRTDDPTG